MENNAHFFLGVMSGTSLDGIDIAYVNLTEENQQYRYQIIAAETIPYPKEWQENLTNAIHLSQSALQEMSLAYADFMAAVIQDFCLRHTVKPDSVVCSHGHTIWHQPEKGITVQIGNEASLAKQLQKTVVCDFRVADVQLGGQGAPLVPVGDRLLFSEYDFCLNLGGFANISFEQDDKRIAFDCCPVNTVLNLFAQQLGLPYDDGGKLAASGSVHADLLQELNQLAYYQQSPPKSLGIEWVNTLVLPLIAAYPVSTVDTLATFTEHVACQLGKSFASKPKGRVLVTGGGAYNAFLLERLRAYSSVAIEVPAAQLVEYKEALVFALLGKLKIAGKTNVYKSVTGAKKDHSSGRVFYP